MARKTTGIKIERGSGNVFADLGFPDPELERCERDSEAIARLGEIHDLAK